VGGPFAGVWGRGKKKRPRLRATEIEKLRTDALYDE
jgi:hypothetical protein